MGYRVRAPQGLVGALWGLVVLAFSAGALAQSGGSGGPPSAENCPLSAADTGKEIERTFTSSAGRSIRFRLALPAGAPLDTRRGVFVYFHGNNADPDDTFFPRTDDFGGVADRGLVPVVVRSPERTTVGDSLVRSWKGADQPLIHELLASDFGGCLPLDRSKVYLAGGSQGTCFITDSMLGWLWRDFRGGVLAACGCWGMNNMDTNVAKLRSSFKLFVEVTRGDFLYGQGRMAHDVYKYGLGMDTRGDVDREGGHCEDSTLNFGPALDWMVSGADYPEQRVQEGYWEHVDLHPNYGARAAANRTGRYAVAVRRDSDLPDEDRWLILQKQQELQAAGLYDDWLAEHYPNITTINTLRVTDDYAQTWRDYSMLEHNVLALLVTDDGTLFAGTDEGGLYRAEPDSTTAKPLAFTDEWIGKLSQTKSGKLLAWTTEGLFRSSDHGESWQDLGLPIEAELIGDSSGVTVVRNSAEQLSYSEDEGDTWTPFTLPKDAGALTAFTHFGRTFFVGIASTPEILVSEDAGATWQRRSTPMLVSQMGVTPDGDLLFSSTDLLAFRSKDLGKTFNIEPGYYVINHLSDTAWGPNGKALYADYRGVIRRHTRDLDSAGSGGSSATGGGANGGTSNATAGTHSGGSAGLDGGLLGGATANPPPQSSNDTGGCSCGVATHERGSARALALGAAMLIAIRRRRARRSPACAVGDERAPKLHDE